MDIHPERIVSLCAGVGWLDEGLRLGLEWLGFASRVVAYVERDSYAASVLLARMEESSLEYAAICDSIGDIDERFRGCVDWIVAGFPCQPWSHAGKQQGTDDERWLWPQIANCIRRVGPGGVFLENVPGLISGGGLEYVLSDLAEMGFDAEWGCLTASAVGASHKRQRVFVVADAVWGEWQSWPGRERVFDDGSELADARRDSGETGQQRLHRQATQPKERGTENTELRRTAMGDTQRQRPQGRGLTITQWRDIAGPPDTDRGIFAPGPTADWRDIPEYLWPAIEPGLCELVDGQSVVLDASRADQLRCAGNGCVALQAAAAFVELGRRWRHC